MFRLFRTLNSAFVFVVLVACCQVTFAETRTWKDSTGKFAIEAEYAGIIAGKVRLKKKDGSAISVPLDRLSEDDQEWLKKEASRPKSTPRAMSKEEQEEARIAKEEAEKEAKRKAEDAEEEKAWEEYCREGIEIPKDFKTLHVFDVGGGKFAIAVSTPVWYFAVGDSSVGAEIHHAFWDGKQVHDGTDGFYIVNGQAMKVEMPFGTKRMPNGAAAHLVQFAGKTFEIPFIERRNPFQYGSTAEDLLKIFGEPDHRNSIGLGVQDWHYDRFPYLRLTIQEGKLTTLSGSPRDGVNELREWMAKHGDESRQSK